MEDYTEVVTGRILHADKTPAAGIFVRVYDKDDLLDDYLGADNTDDAGRFRVTFQTSDFKGVFEQRPDIYLKLKDPKTGKKTRTAVFEDLTGELSEDDSEEVMDLGDIELS